MGNLGAAVSEGGTTDARDAFDGLFTWSFMVLEAAVAYLLGAKPG